MRRSELIVVMSEYDVDHLFIDAEENKRTKYHTEYLYYELVRIKLTAQT